MLAFNLGQNVDMMLAQQRWQWRRTISRCAITVDRRPVSIIGSAASGVTVADEGQGLFWVVSHRQTLQQEMISYLDLLKSVIHKQNEVMLCYWVPRMSQNVLCNFPFLDAYIYLLPNK